MINVNNLESDKQLVLLVKNNPDYFELIMHRYWTRIGLDFLVVSGECHTSLKRILQEAFVKIYRYLNDYDDSKDDKTDF